MIETQVIPYRDQDASLNGFLAWDTSQTSNRPGVLIVHGGAGLDDHARVGRAVLRNWVSLLSLVTCMAKL